MLDVEYVQFSVRMMPQDPIKAEETRRKMIEAAKKRNADPE
jgi:hypothetical protein